MIDDGKLYKLVTATNRFTLSDYNQNTDVLTHADGARQKMGFTFPNGNTRPQDLSVIFSDTPGKYKPIRDEALRHDIVAIKSCYPNSDIASDTELETIKQHYIAICTFFAGHAKELVILTSPPLTPLMTNPANAGRARQLAAWLASTNFGDTIRVFNLFGALAAPIGDRNGNMLKREYQRWLPFDSHPNRKASKEIAQQLVNFLLKSRIT